MFYAPNMMPHKQIYPAFVRSCVAAPNMVPHNLYAEWYHSPSVFDNQRGKRAGGPVTLQPLSLYLGREVLCKYLDHKNTNHGCPPQRGSPLIHPDASPATRRRVRVPSRSCSGSCGRRTGRCSAVRSVIGSRRARPCDGGKSAGAGDGRWLGAAVCSLCHPHDVAVQIKHGLDEKLSTIDEDRSKVASKPCERQDMRKNIP